MNLKCFNIFLLLLLIALGACKKTSNQVVDNTIPVTLPTKDFREDYTGYFLVNIGKHSSYHYNIYSHDTVYGVKVKMTYNIKDSSSYKSQGKIIATLPALTMMGIVNDQFNDTLGRWGIVDSVKGKLIADMGSDGYDTRSNEGGFITKDSINFTYRYVTPHVSNLYVVWGSRIK